MKKKKAKTPRRKKRPVKKSVKKKSRRSKSSAGDLLKQEIMLQKQYEKTAEQIENLWQYAEKTEERLQDLEIHVNLLTRLFTTLCIEKFGMRVGVLKRIIKRIEKETIRDSQIDHLEFLYKLPMRQNKRQKPSSKDDPWDDIT